MPKRPMWALNSVRESREIEIDYRSVESLIAELKQYRNNATVDREDSYGYCGEMSSRYFINWTRDMTDAEYEEAKIHRASERERAKLIEAQDKEKRRKKFEALREEFG